MPIRSLFHRSSPTTPNATPEHAPATPPPSPARPARQRATSWLRECLVPAQAREDRAADRQAGAGPRIVAGGPRASQAGAAPSSPLHAPPSRARASLAATAASPSSATGARRGQMPGAPQPGPHNFNAALQAWAAGTVAQAHDFHTDGVSGTATPAQFGQAVAMVADRIRAVHNGHASEIRLLGQPVMHLPEAIGELYGLRELNLVSCDVRSLPQSLGRLARLNSLRLQGNHRLHALPRSLGQLPGLRSLHIVEGRVRQLPPLGGLSQLQELNLGNLPLGSMPRDLTALPYLRTLRVAGCNLAEVPTDIGRLQRLSNLNLSANPQLSRLPEEIGRLHNLQTLDLRGCSGLRTLPASIGDLPQLNRLVLTGCSQLTGLPDSILRLANRCDIRLPTHLQHLRASVPAAASSSAAAPPPAAGDTLHELAALTPETLARRIDAGQVAPRLVIELGMRHAAQRSSTPAGQLRVLKDWPPLHAYARQHDPVTQQIMKLVHEESDRVEDRLEDENDNLNSQGYEDAYKEIQSGLVLALEGRPEVRDPHTRAVLQPEVIGRHQQIAVEWMRSTNTAAQQS
ncbi:hypothetical protein D0T25_24360 [Duganella sp. BJB488]|uniref:leucine-rich repeat domain-containing protein n=1 Tax=unclassified Duganella TaxID=2636909 RepID=UPI000E3571A9|nr:MULTISPECIES: leucine-rich repeat domain-containing protein [unclassified Duganella]RFP09321.1 hypothetical protein D0T23_26825 [Duganella sp. BJB475]RFP13209.1 hypothetical protein D0T26_23260 [Duganella sp. BJB489]RFP17216.1 hypothetical protein D0T25_24360 [Duganella sp. BJB488]RFP25357.1 hypothetical protein D0T21_27855 [Duganella sp. BJB476]RFP31564.1 hypothetical protein D0T24_24355 [Duganella sp. BJB480]